MVLTRSLFKEVICSVGNERQTPIENLYTLRFEENSTNDANYEIFGDLEIPCRSVHARCENQISVRLHTQIIGEM